MCFKNNIMDEKIKISMKDGHVDLSNLNLESMPELSEEILNTQYLFLNDNNFKNLNLENFKNLKVLDISNNPIERIQYLPDSLVELACNECDLKFIIGHKNLNKLYCNKNKLEELNEYPSLIDLECQYNILSKINTFENLEELTCNNNPLIEICNQPKLIHLECNDTLISNLPNIMGKIKTINIINTKINQIPYIDSLLNIATKKDVLISSQYKIESHVDTENGIDIIFTHK